MKVGDLVKYESWHTGLQDRTGLVVETRPDRFYHGRVLVLWSRPWAHSLNTPRWDWVKDLKVIK